MRTKMDSTNPAPFVQPFLELWGPYKPGIKNLLFIDVNGEIEKYITDKNEPTEELLRLCKLLQTRGYEIAFFARYGPGGNGGPDHILRNGALFARMQILETSEPQSEDEDPDPDGESVELAVVPKFSKYAP